MAIYKKTELREMPENCFVCSLYGYRCAFPSSKPNQLGIFKIKDAYRTKRHPKCPLVELSEPEE